MLAAMHIIRLCWLLALLQVAVLWSRSTWLVHRHDSIFSRALLSSSTTARNLVSEVQHQQQPRTSRQYVRYNKRGTKQVMKAIKAVHRSDLTDLNDDDIFVQPVSSSSGRVDKREVLELLQEAGISEVDDETASLLPTWKELTDLYGDLLADQPIYTAGKETCQRFRDSVSPDRALIGTAGMFNSGTNAMTYYLRANLRMQSAPDRPKRHHDGILSQVPWDKHYFASLKHNHTAKHFEAYTKEHVLPIVVIRDPLTWLHTMCTIPYMVEFGGSSMSGKKSQENQFCPHLASDDSSQHVVSMPVMTEKTWATLLHLWNDWYREYLHAFSDPFLMVRFEDLLFRPRAVLDVVRECAGAAWTEEDTFTYVVDQSKWEHVRFHGPQSNMISAMIKHGNAARRLKHMTARDLQVAREVLDPELMKIFGYQYPSA